MRPSGGRTQRLGAKRLGSVWRHAAGEHLEQVRKALTDDFDKEESVIGTEPLPDNMSKTFLLIEKFPRIEEPRIVRSITRYY